MASTSSTDVAVTTTSASRSGYIDLLRAAAIARVVVYHTVGWAWLTVAFPAMGLMFALGGSLMAASLDRYGRTAVVRRVRRILPPVWLIGAAALAAMTARGGFGVSWRWVLWLVPVDDPPVSEWAAPALGILWYVRSYLWFVLLSPLLLPLFRRRPTASVLVPFGVLVGLATLGQDTGGVVRDFFLYLPMWLIGFAHHDRLLERIPARLLWPVVAVLGAVGLTLLYRAPGPRGYDLNDAPVADVPWSVAVLLVLLALVPRLRRPRRRGEPFWPVVPLRVARGRHPTRQRLSGRLGAALRAVNHRALTIYLWHQAAIWLVATAVEPWLPGGTPARLGAVLVILATAVATFGWVEDVAAGRRPAILPDRWHGEPSRAAA
ncbi:acyltransferase family protein [Dactylosporangium sucinum]|nr:acyltransferase family protein [Dactylosporangium sucinum]